MALFCSDLSFFWISCLRPIFPTIKAPTASIIPVYIWLIQGYDQRRYAYPSDQTAIHPGALGYICLRDGGSTQQQRKTSNSNQAGMIQRFTCESTRLSAREERLESEGSLSCRCALVRDPSDTLLISPSADLAALEVAMVKAARLFRRASKEGNTSAR